MKKSIARKELSREEAQGEGYVLHSSDKFIDFEQGVTKEEIVKILELYRDSEHPINEILSAIYNNLALTEKEEKR